MVSGDGASLSHLMNHMYQEEKQGMPRGHQPANYEYQQALHYFIAALFDHNHVSKIGERYDF
jgi:hypothetical protein